MKILAEGHKSIHDGSAWTPGKWREEPDAVRGSACGVGLHSIIGGDPLKAPVFTWPCEVWQDECEDELGRDEIKARYRRQRAVEEITDKFPIIVEMNAFIRKIPKVSWLKPKDDTTPDWMRVTPYSSLDAARDAARDAAGDAAWDAAWDAARDAAWAAARAAAWDAARDAAGDAAWAALSILVSDLQVDSTWLRCWWQAWEMGYYPIRENANILIVGKIENL